MKTITVFTPAYNRAHLLGRLYESLLRQTRQDFVWLVVDDGSTDGTRELVAGWQAEGWIEIQYEYKPNGGMHTAHNRAYDLIQTELNVCIDSDDWMPDNAVELICARWKEVRNEPGIAGIVGLDESPDGKIIGSQFPADGLRCTLAGLYEYMGVRGDKKLVYKSDVTRSFPRYPEFSGERLVPLGWLYRQIDQRYELIAFNDVYVVVDYQIGGSSDSIISQYFQSPRGFQESRIMSIKYAGSLKDKLRNVVHFGVSSLILGRWRTWLHSPAPILSFLTWPLSVTAFVYLAVRKSLPRRA